MLPYQPALAEVELALAGAPPPLFAVVSPDFLSGFLASPFFAANFLGFSFSFAGTA